MSLADIAYRLSVDPQFEQSLRSDPEQALSLAGLCLDPDEQQSLQLLLQTNPSKMTFDPDDGIPVDPWLAS